MFRDFKLALCQFIGGMNKEANLRKAEEMVARAAAAGSQVVVLPECFNSPYGTAHFANYAEDVSDASAPSVRLLKTLATRHSVYLIGGSIPERSGDRLYNTCLCFNPAGEVIGKHRKVHLFDINVPGGITFFESDVLTPGDQATIIQTEFCRIGVGICYDVRFPEYAWTLAREEDVGMILYPGCFNMVTGPRHWELLMRARAVDNLIYVAGCSQARDTTAGYVSWGHSLLVNPLGEVHELDEKEGLLIHDVRFETLVSCRNSIWSRKHKRFELYKQ
jgi:omega-amidase